MAITTTMSCIKLQSLIFEGFSSKFHHVLLPKLLTKPPSFQASLSCRNLPPFKRKQRHLLKAFSEELPHRLGVRRQICALECRGSKLWSTCKLWPCCCLDLNLERLEDKAVSKRSRWRFSRALIPNSADKPLRELIEEIVGDHEMMSKQSS